MSSSVPRSSFCDEEQADVIDRLDVVGRGTLFDLQVGQKWEDKKWQKSSFDLDKLTTAEIRRLKF